MFETDEYVSECFRKVSDYLYKTDRYISSNVLLVVVDTLSRQKVKRTLSANSVSSISTKTDLVI